MADAETPSGFEIAGDVYEIPRLETFDLDEAQLLYDISGVILEDWMPPHPDSPDDQKALVFQLQAARTRDPSFKRALVHIAYRRKYPDEEFETVEKIVGGVNATDVTVAILTRGDEPDPSTSSPSKPDSKSNTNGTSEPSSSGSPSGSDSERPALTLAPTGVSPLGTSYQPSAPTEISSAS